MDLRSDNKMTSSKPYFFRAILEWIEDNDLTPHILVDSTQEGVDVPMEYVNEGEIVLNLSSASVKIFENNNTVLVFEARFSGKLMRLFVPITAIKAVFAKENQQGIFFNENVDSHLIESGQDLQSDKGRSISPKDNDLGRTDTKKTSKKNKSNSHLKIIK